MVSGRWGRMRLTQIATSGATNQSSSTGAAAGKAAGAIMIMTPATSTASTGEAAMSRQAASRRSEEHTSELQSLMRISYAVFCLKKKKTHTPDKDNILMT